MKTIKRNIEGLTRLSNMADDAFTKDANYQDLVNGVCKTFLVGGMKARDFLTDSLGLSHTASIDEIINNLKSVLQ